MQEKRGDKRRKIRTEHSMDLILTERWVLKTENQQILLLEGLSEAIKLPRIIFTSTISSYL